MLFCEPCRERNGWPSSTFKRHNDGDVEYET